MVKKIIEGYGWTICETGIEDKGAKFVINIPKKSTNLEKVAPSKNEKTIATDQSTNVCVSDALIED